MQLVDKGEDGTISEGGHLVHDVALCILILIDLPVFLVLKVGVLVLVDVHHDRGLLKSLGHWTVAPVIVPDKQVLAALEHVLVQDWVRLALHFVLLCVFHLHVQGFEDVVVGTLLLLQGFLVVVLVAIEAKLALQLVIDLLGLVHVLDRVE